MSAATSKVDKIKDKIFQKLTDDDETIEDLYNSTLWTAIKTRNKYTTIDDITDESELQFLYDILDNYGDNVEYINTKLEPTDSIRDIYHKIKDVADSSSVEAFEEANSEEEDEEDRKEERSTATVLTQDRVEIVPFNDLIHCERDENCNEVDITGILSSEEKMIIICLHSAHLFMNLK